MILAIDGYEANTEVRVGIGRYAFELIERIARRQAGRNPPFTDVLVYLPEAGRPHMPEESAAFHYRVVGPKPLWTFLGFPLALMLDRKKSDVVFSPTHYLPRWVTVPRVIAVMDVSYLTYPELFRPSDLHKLVNWTAFSVAHAAKVITISEFSKHAIIDAYHVPDNRVVVAYPALPEWQENHPMGTSKKMDQLPKRYILTVGTLQPRKNFARLISAFSTIPDKEIALIIVGKKGWLYDEILEAPAKFGVEDRVRFMDFVPDDQLPDLYTHAECFVLPSLYEGFGLPVLEAMSYGTPVVVSNISSLPEIAGEAGIYIQPDSTKSIADGISQALSETKAARAKRVALGKKRVTEFTWDKAADRVIEVLSEVGRKGGV